MTTLFLIFKKIESENKTNYKSFYSNSKAEAIINECRIDDLFQLIFITIMEDIRKFQLKDSNWIYD